MTMHRGSCEGESAVLDRGEEIRERPAPRGYIGVIAGAFVLIACRPLGPADAGASVKAPNAPVFQPTIENKAPAPAPSPPGMVWIPGGEFSMGSADELGMHDTHGMLTSKDAQPIHRVYVDGFWMDATEVTNEAFARFVEETGYVTVAERTPTGEEFADVPQEGLVAGSILFEPTGQPVPLDNAYAWWRYLPGASWRHPEGPGSDLQSREKHPVVHVAYDDAVEYAKWAGKRLATEAEWEFAARGGLTGKRYPWGDDFASNGQGHANTWHGTFPAKDTGEDGFAGIAPVASFAPNGYGLYDMGGNVWEWVSDWYRPDYYARLAASGIARNPSGPESSFDPEEPGVSKRAQRGGSFLCTDQYCARYRVGTRGKGEVNSTANHVGFRLVRDAE
jgi:sulfatase modifying factor 1